MIFDQAVKLNIRYITTNGILKLIFQHRHF